MLASLNRPGTLVWVVDLSCHKQNSLLTSFPVDAEQLSLMKFLLD